MREQWWDEERLDDEFFSVPCPAIPSANWNHQEAFNWYHRKDGKIVGLWKWSEAALSSDEGKTWSRPVKCPTLQMTGAKISGTQDQRWPIRVDLQPQHGR